MGAVETVLRFLERINERDPDRLAELMTEDHEFIDSLGQSARGRETMRAGWRGYYALCPDYRITHDRVLHQGNVVAVFGKDGGTVSEHGKLLPENRWRTPAAWLAVVEKDRVKSWRVYADNKPVYDILARSDPREGA